MKKEILEALAAKFEGVSSAVLDRIANKLAKTITKTEDIATAVEGVTIQQIIDSYTDSRITEASETARKNAVNDYESKYGLKDGVKTVDNNPQETQGADVDATQQLMQQFWDRWKITLKPVPYCKKQALITAFYLNRRVSLLS